MMIKYCLKCCYSKPMDICGYNHFFKAQTRHEKCLHTEFFSSPYFSIFGLNSENYGPEKIRIWTLFAQ